MGTAKMYFDSKNNRWVLSERGGSVIAEFDGTSARFPNGLKVGAGSEITKSGKLTGTIGAIAAVGTIAIATGTVTGMTGLAVGDIVTVVPKAAIGGDNVLSNFRIPTTNTLNVSIHNVNINSAGSLVAVGVDVFYQRI